MEEYFAAKAQLFTREHAQCAVIWCDDPYGQELASSVALGVSEVHRNDATEVTPSLLGTTFFGVSSWSRRHSLATSTSTTL